MTKEETLKWILSTYAPCITNSIADHSQIACCANKSHNRTNKMLCMLKNKKNLINLLTYSIQKNKIFEMKISKVMYLPIHLPRQASFVWNCMLFANYRTNERTNENCCRVTFQYDDIRNNYLLYLLPDYYSCWSIHNSEYSVWKNDFNTSIIPSKLFACLVLTMNKNQSKSRYGH